MGKNGFTETDILKLKEAEKAKAPADSGSRGGCGPLSIIIGLALIIAGLFFASAMQGKTLHPTVTSIAQETAVSVSATPTLAPTATNTAAPVETATALPTDTPLPTQTPYPTYTPYPSATWTAQPTFTPQATFTPEPTHTALPTYTPYPTATPTDEPTAVPVVATERPFLAPVAIEADPPNDNPLPGWLPWLIGGLGLLLLTALLVLAYVTHQMRPVPQSPAPVFITPDGVPVPGTYGTKLPPPSGQPRREPKNAPVPEPVTPVTPPEVAPVQEAGKGAAPETIQVSVTDANPDTDEATMRAICTAWNEIEARGERPSLNKTCVEYFGGKNSERLAIVRRAVGWGRKHGLIANKKSKEVKHDPANRSEPTPNQQPDQQPRRRPITLIDRRGRGVLN